MDQIQIAKEDEIILSAWDKDLRCSDDRDNTFAFYAPLYSWRVEEFSEFLAEQTGDIRIRFNSPGGDFFAGLALANRIIEYDKGKVTAINDALTASAAALPYLAADVRHAYKSPQFLLHNTRVFSTIL